MVRLSRFHPAHSIPLLLGTVFTIGAMMPLWNPDGAMREFGLPEHIVVSKEAQSVFVVYAARMTAWGMGMWTFYLRGDMKAVDTMMALTLYISAVDCYICAREGALGQGIFRLSAGVLVSGWGFLGLTSRFARP